jgi:myosin heavy subunit
MSVLAAWISSRRLNSEAEACKRLQLFPLNDADQQLLNDVLCLQQWPVVQRQAMLSASVKVQRQAQTAGMMNLEDWTAEKCIRKLRKLDQSFWVKDGTQRDDEQSHDPDTFTDSSNCSGMGESEANHALRMTRTPGRFNEWDDIDWSESEESEEEEISESESQPNEGSIQDEDESYEEEESDLEAEVKKFAPLIDQTPGLKDWLKSAQSNIKQLEKENFEQATKIQILTDGLKEHERKLEIAHKEQKTTTKLLEQREKELRIVHEEQKTNRKLLEQNYKELTVVRDQQSITNKQADLELHQRQKNLDVRLAELQKYQQQLLELSSGLEEYAGIVNSSGRTWWDLIYKPGMMVLDAISNVQRQYNNPTSLAFKSSYTMGPEDPSGSSTPDRQKQQEHNLRLIRAKQGMSRLPLRRFPPCLAS